MMKNIYQELGFLILGSRLRRMSEYFLAEVNKVYQKEGINFEAGWFPLFFILSRQRAASLKAVSDELMISHSAVSQLIKSLKEKALVETVSDPKDKRSQLIKLSPSGKSLLKRLKPIWEVIDGSLIKMEKIHPVVGHFLPAMEDLEAHFEEQSLSDIITCELKSKNKREMSRAAITTNTTNLGYNE